MNRLEKKQALIRKLSEFLAGPNTAKYSIELAQGSETAKLWAEMRGLTPLFGYPTVDEAEKILCEFLG